MHTEMNTTQLWISFLFAALMAAVCPATAADKPNIIIFLADDLGYADIGVQGCEDVPTPHIDSIARDGVRFTDGYATHPVCSPSRAGLMSGMYQHRFGFEHNSGPERYAAQFRAAANGAHAGGEAADRGLRDRNGRQVAHRFPRGPASARTWIRRLLWCSSAGRAPTYPADPGRAESVVPQRRRGPRG